MSTLPFELMRAKQWSNVLVTLLLANAVAILPFRFFITVDGPTHVLHAALLEAPWNSTVHAAKGIIYNGNALHGWLGDRILSLLLLFRTPETAHDLFAALVSCAVVCSVVIFQKAHGSNIGLSILWLAPLTFSFILVMGLFHFLLGVAVSFGTVAWWRWHNGAPGKRWLGLLVGVVLAWFTHRGAPILLGALFLVSLALELDTKRVFAGKDERRSPLRWMAILGAGLLVVVLALDRIALGGVLPHTFPNFNEDLLLRPFLLLDPVRELSLARAIGVLLLLSISAGVWLRIRMGLRLFPQDALVGLVLFFQLIAWLGNTPHGRQLLIAERCQWLTLVVVVIWLGMMADRHRGPVSKLIGIPVLLALPLHVVRMVQVEQTFHQLQRPHQLAIEAAGALAPGTVVMPVTAGRNPMLQHLEAYIAVRHSGILLAGSEQIALSITTAEADERLHRMTVDPHWLARHWRTGIPQEVDEILFIGHDIERMVGKHPWPILLKDRYRPSFENGYARIYTRTK